MSRAQVVRLDSLVYKLTRDIEVLHQLAEQLVDQTDQRGYQALYTANQMVNSIIAGQDRWEVVLLFFLLLANRLVLYEFYKQSDTEAFFSYIAVLYPL